jgi:hypothetical protein
MSISPSFSAAPAAGPVDDIEQIEQTEQIDELEVVQAVEIDVPRLTAADVADVAARGPEIPTPIEADDRPPGISHAPRPHAPRPAGPRPVESRQPAQPIARHEQPRGPVEGEEATIERTATAPQLRRFIKSRAYVPMHELRRRFLINGGDDEVTPVDLERKRVFVGLPEREGRLLGELLRAGDIGYELSLDPISPIVVGVYPMRPVTRV